MDPRSLREPESRPRTQPVREPGGDLWAGSVWRERVYNPALAKLREYPGLDWDAPLESGKTSAQIVASYVREGNSIDLKEMIYGNLAAHLYAEEVVGRKVLPLGTAIGNFLDSIDVRAPRWLAEITYPKTID